MKKTHRNIYRSETEKLPGYDGIPTGKYLCKVIDKNTRKAHLVEYWFLFGHRGGYVNGYVNPWKIGFFDELRCKEEAEELGCPNGIAFPNSFTLLKKLDNTDFCKYIGEAKFNHVCNP